MIKQVHLLILTPKSGYPQITDYMIIMCITQDSPEREIGDTQREREREGQTERERRKERERVGGGEGGRKWELTHPKAVRQVGRLEIPAR